MKSYSVATAIICGVLLANPSLAGGFKLESTDLTPGKKMSIDHVFSGFGCTGKNISPALQWQNAPKNTKSFAITVYDPDAPTGSGWWHWILFNIPVTTTSLARNAGDPASLLSPEGSIQSKTDFGTPGYGGACPPVGDKPHRYQFTVFALDVEKLPLESNASGAMVGFYFHQHMIGKASITVFYSR